jgi:hypothetical protein
MLLQRCLGQLQALDRPQQQLLAARQPLTTRQWCRLAHCSYQLQACGQDTAVGRLPVLVAAALKPHTHQRLQQGLQAGEGWGAGQAKGRQGYTCRTPTTVPHHVRHPTILQLLHVLLLYLLLLLVLHLRLVL